MKNWFRAVGGVLKTLAAIAFVVIGGGIGIGVLGHYHPWAIVSLLVIGGLTFWTWLNKITLDEEDRIRAKYGTPRNEDLLG